MKPASRLDPTSIDSRLDPSSIGSLALPFFARQVIKKSKYSFKFSAYVGRLATVFSKHQIAVQRRYLACWG